MENKHFSVRRFEETDIDGIVNLFRKVFHGDFSRSWWEWKYLQNPAGFRGEDGDVWVADSGDGRVVGHWAIIPEELKLGSKTVKIGQAVDAATDPDYQGRGIFKTLVKNVCSDAIKRYNLIYGYPNELYKGYERLGWMSYRITEFLNFINYERSLKSYFKNRILFGLAKAALKTFRARSVLGASIHFKKTTGDQAEIEEAAEFPKEIDAFWKESRSEHEVIIERDYRFLLWRFSDQFGSYRRFIARSSNTGKILGYSVVKKTSLRGIPGILDIVDLQVLPNQDRIMVDLVKVAIDMAAKEEFNVLHCRVPSWHRYAAFLRRLRFVGVGNILERAKLYQPRLITYPPTQEEIDVNKWFYTLADTDYA